VAKRERPLLLSSNIRQLIEPLLEHFGVEADLLANELVSDGESGWRVHFGGEICPVCGERCKRPKLPPGEVVYVGNGYSASLPGARLLAHLRPLRAWLAIFDAIGKPYEPFGDFHQIASALERSV